MRKSFRFHYCCPHQFAKLYGKYMRDIRKQYGVKGMANLTIKGFDQGLSMAVKAEWPGQICSKCRKDHGLTRRRKGMPHNKNITFSKFTILVTDETED